MLGRRLLTAFLLAPLIILAIIAPNAAIFKSLILLVVVLTLIEFYTITLPESDRIEKIFGVFIGALFSGAILFCPYSPESLLMVMTMIMVAIFIFYLMRPPETLKGLAPRIAMFSLGTLYVGGLLSYLGLLRDYPHGAYWVILALSMTWLNDTFAYFAGHWWGRHRLAPLISPGKTIEGFLGGFVGSWIGFLFFSWLMGNPCSWIDGLILTAIVGTLGPIGDLSESLIKRSTGVKDSGTLIPGHGGVLDRVDALLFTAPALYYFARFIYS
jgi:phosphatidate cytidylyltransferase